MAKHNKPITFKATISPLIAAIKVTGDNAGLRVQFDIPETELANALGLLTMRDVVLEVSVRSLGKMKPQTERTDTDDILDLFESE